MNFKFLKQAMCLMLGCCVINNIAQSMESSSITQSIGSKEELNSSNFTNQTKEEIVTKLENINFEKEITLVNKTITDEDYNQLKELNRTIPNYNSTTENIVNFIKNSAGCIKKAYIPKHGIDIAIYDSMNKKFDILKIKKEIESSKEYNDDKDIKELIDEKLKYSDDTLGKVRQISREFGHYFYNLMRELKNLKYRLEDRKDVDDNLIAEMNKALENI